VKLDAIKHTRQNVQLRQSRDIQTIVPSKETASQDTLSYSNAGVPNMSALQ